MLQKKWGIMINNYVAIKSNQGERGKPLRHFVTPPLRGEACVRNIDLSVAPIVGELASLDG